MAALVLAVAPLVTASTCRPGLTKACDVRYGDLVVHNGEVVGTTHPVCDPPPQSHLLRATIEFAVADTWIELGRVAVTNQVPDTTGFDVEVRAECREGTYRVKVHVEGAGPDGSLFVFDDTGQETPIALGAGNGAVAQNPQVRPLPPSFVGRRVVWRGPAQRGFVPPEQRRAILDGVQRPPTPEEQLELRTDDVGEVIELVTVTSAGHQYAIRFANGYEIEVVLPLSIVTFLDENPPPAHRPPQYASYRDKGGTLNFIRRRFRRSF